MVAIGSFERIFSLLVQFSVVLGFQFFLFFKIKFAKIHRFLHTCTCLLSIWEAHRLIHFNIDFTSTLIFMVATYVCCT